MRQKAFAASVWVAVALLAGLDAWHGRHDINPDGISYIEIAEAYLRGDWSNALNAYWSPLYSWLVAAVFFVVRPAPAWELTVIHGLNVLIFLGAYACFRYFLGAVRSGQRIWPFVGHAIFLWCSLRIVGLNLVTPDLLAAGFVFLAAGAYPRLYEDGSRRAAAFLGASLGLGYLAKSHLFPLAAILFISLALFQLPRRRLVTACLAFAITAGPFALVLSVRCGRPMFSDAGRLNYAWFVDGVRLYAGWTGELPSAGTPVHPPRRLLNNPTVLHYCGYPFQAASSPAWYDPTFWHTGLRVRFDPKAHLRVFGQTLRELWLVALFHLELCLGLILGLFLTRPRMTIGAWVLVAWSVAGLAMFVLVHVEPRLVAPFLALPFLLVFRGLLAGGGDIRTARTVVFGAGAALLVHLLLPVPAMLSQVAREISSGAAVSPHWADAVEFRRLGLRAGDEVAAAGRPFGWYSVRLAGLKLTGGVPEGEASSPPVLGAVAGAGLKAVLSEKAPAGLPHGWRRLPGTGAWVRLLQGD